MTLSNSKSVRSPLYHVSSDITLGYVLYLSEKITVSIGTN